MEAAREFVDMGLPGVSSGSQFLGDDPTDRGVHKANAIDQHAEFLYEMTNKAGANEERERSMAVAHALERSTDLVDHQKDQIAAYVVDQSDGWVMTRVSGDNCRAALERRRGNGGGGGDGDVEGSGGEWRLTWDRSAYSITRSYSSVVDRESCETIHCRVSRRAFGGSGGGGGVDDAGRVEQWVVISSKFCPDRPAREAYEDHTKRSYSGLEEVSLLFLLPPG